MRRFIGDSQTQYWHLAVECFLSPYRVRAARTAPTTNSASNLWLVKFDEWQKLKGSPHAPPKASVCLELQARTAHARRGKAEQDAFKASAC